MKSWSIFCGILLMALGTGAGASIIDDFDVPSGGSISPGNSQNDSGIGSLSADRYLEVPAGSDTINFGATAISTLGGSNFDVGIEYSGFGPYDITIGGADRFIFTFDNSDAGIIFPAASSSLTLGDLDEDIEVIDISTLLQAMPVGGVGHVEVLFSSFTNPDLDFDQIDVIDFGIESNGGGASLDLFALGGPAIPEPGTLGLLVAAGAGMLFRRRRHGQTA